MDMLDTSPRSRVNGHATASSLTDVRAVAVAGANLWTSPDAVRPLDASAVSTHPDLRRWAGAHDVEERRALWGRVNSQLLLGEPVAVHERVDGWVRVTAPWQPSAADPRGYPGWLPERQLAEPAPPATGGLAVVVVAPTTSLRDAPAGRVTVPDVSFGTVLPLLDETPGWQEVSVPGGGRGWLSAAHTRRRPVGGRPPTATQIIVAARQLLGTAYFVGGTSGLAVDCSGLVHLVYRRFGVTVPRDADEQYALGEPIDPADAEPGDLLFFASAGAARFDHVAICLGGDEVLHASQGAWQVLDEPLPAARRDDLCGARRFRRG
ncbi:C40 family peptidase [Phytohabitans rumicis]|uniref:Peptidase P60 n=1 Tax=Phytohabitans rumicis TaxID=1076125 RepID=A0A6V8LJG3_9ACTN|nr:C40 family peptidase [Phytohabitans rumicis]GFJ92755.1 peptidase P60 [Phytohabitans rumicis]